MTPSYLAESLAYMHIADLHADAELRRASARARRTHTIGPLRARASRLLVRSGIRLAGRRYEDMARTVPITSRNPARGEPPRAPAAPRRRAA